MNGKLRILYAGLMLAILISQLSWGEKPSQIIQRLKAAGSDERRKSDLLRSLEQALPQDPDDIDSLVEAAKDEKLRNSSLYTLRKSSISARSEMRAKFIELIDIDDPSNDQKILSTVLAVCEENKIIEATPKVIERLNKEPKERIRDEDDLARLSRLQIKGGRRGVRAVKVKLLAESLARMKDQKSVDLLFSLDEVLCTGNAGSVLAPLGLPALEKAIQIAKTESGLRKEGALQVISQSTYAEALPRIKELLKSPDRDLRHYVINGLTQANVPELESLLLQTISDPDDRIRRFSVHKLYWYFPVKYRNEIRSSMYGKGLLDKLSAMIIVGNNPNLIPIPELKQFIKDDEKTNPHRTAYRRHAAKAIWKATGEKIEYYQG